jgi:hypothetical protein
MPDRSINVTATFKVHDRPLIPELPVQVTIRFPVLASRASAITARVGDQYLEAVVKLPDEPAIVGHLTRVPRPGDEVFIRDGAMEMPTGIRYAG